jgi:hypothetical protein
MPLMGAPAGGLGGAVGVARTAAAAALIAVLLLLLSTGSPGLLSGAVLPSAGTADTWGHAWGYWWVEDALLHGRFPLHQAPLLAPKGQSWWVVDFPVAVLLAPVTWALGAGAALGLSFALHVATGAAGSAWWLVRRGVAPWLAVAGAVLVATSPFVRGAIWSGIPEALAVLLIPSFAVLLEDGAARGGRRWAAAAVLAAWLCFDGFYGALPAALVGLAVSIARLQAVGRAALPRLFVVALVGGVAAVGQIALVRASDHPVLSRPTTMLPPPTGTDDWVVQALGGADLLNFIGPAPLLPSVPPEGLHQHIVYVGLPLLALALWACRRSATARVAMVVAFVCGLLSLGASLRVGGRLVWENALPGAWLLATGAKNLYRLAGVLPLLLLAAVLPRWTGRSAVALVAVVALDWLLLSPLPVRLATVANPVGAVEAWLRDQREPGAVFDVPVDRDGMHWPGAWPQRSFYLQSAHQRPIASGLYERPPLATSAPVLRDLERAVRVAGTQQLAGEGGGQVVLPAVQAADGAAARQALIGAGFRFVSLDLEQLPVALRPAAVQHLGSWLGPPAVVDGARLAWRL